MSDTELTLSGRLQRVVFAAIADDLTEPGTAARRRHNQRLEVMREAAIRLGEFERMFDVRFDADMRAIKRWQAVSGKTLSWPEHSDLCVWLMEQLEDAKHAPSIQPITS